jgi:hypothetical protein
MHCSFRARRKIIYDAQKGDRRVPELWGIRNHLNLDDLEHTTDDEIDAFLTSSRTGRGPLDPGPQYDMRANSLWLYTRPDIAKLHGRMLDGWHGQGLEPIITASSFANLHTYINQAWETGIENCTRGLQQRGVTRAQLMEAIMHAQLSGGMRGLECVYRAIGVILGDYVERPEPAVWPKGWAPDMAPFYCGLDPSTKELTFGDRRALHDWYMGTIGEIPSWVMFLEKYDPTSLKAYRSKWEGVFRGALPKQMMPYLMLRHSAVTANRAGLREAALLGKAWGLTNAYIVNTIVQGAYYFTGLENLDFIEGALDDVLG